MSRPHLEGPPNGISRGARTAVAAAGAVLLLAVLVAGVVSAGAADRRAMALGPSYPQVSGDRVVWQDTATNNVVLSDVARDSTYAVPYAHFSLMQVGAGQSPGLDGTRLGIWDRNQRVRSYVLGSAPSTVSGSSLAEQSVAVSGNRVAWTDIRAGSTAKRIYTATVGGAESLASATTALQQSPALAGTLLAWEDKRNGDMDVYMRDLTGGTVTNLTRPTGVLGDQFNPAVSGTRIVWEDGRSNKDASKDIYMLEKTQSPSLATNLTPDPSTALSAQMLAGASSASVYSTAGFEVGDYVEIVTGTNVSRLRIASIAANTLVFSSSAVYTHNTTNQVRVASKEQRPDISVDATGYTVVWQTNRKSASVENFDIRGARYTLADVRVAVYQITRTDIGTESRPRVDGWRIVYQKELGGSSSIERYELMPFAYGDAAGGGTSETTRVPARISYAGRTATYRFGFGSTPGATDLSGGYSAETPSATVALIGSGSTPRAGELAVPAASISLAEGTTYYVTAQVNEGGSWGATATSSSVKVDVTNPSAPTNVAATRDSAGASLSWDAASDGVGSGIDAYEVWRASISPPATETVSETQGTTFRDDGAYGLASAPASGTAYRYWVLTRDKAGNQSAGVVASAPAPVTALTTAPAAPNGANGWYATAPSITLTPSEPSTTYYRWDGGGWLTYAAPLTAAQGTHTLDFYSVSPAGGTESTRSRTLKTDTGAPADPVLSTPTHTPGVVSRVPTVTVDVAGAADGVSGVDGFSVSWSANTTAVPDTIKDHEESLTSTTTALTDGRWWFNLRTRDNAGNWTSTAHIGPFIIDATRPTSTLTTAPAAPNGANGWYVTAPGIRITANETATRQYQWDGTAGAWSTFSTTITAAEGTHTLYHRSIDTAGNTETARSAVFKTDTGAPIDPALSTSTHTLGVISNASTVTVDLAGAADAVSGLDGFSVSWTRNTTALPDTIKDLEGSLTSITTSVPDGAWWFNLRTRDIAGNWTATQHLGPFLIEARAPVTAVTTAPADPDGENGWYRTAPNITLDPDEPATTYYYWDGGPWQTYSSPLTAPEGSHTLGFCSVDSVPNTEAVRARSFKVDTQAPSGSMSLNVGQTLTYSRTLMVGSAATDGGSGMGAMRIDAGGGYGAWTAYAASTSVEVPAGDGTKTVNVQYKDQAGNVRTLTDDIRYRRPKATFTRPTVSPASPFRYRYFTVVGYLKPYHSGKTKLYFYRKIGRRWYYYRYAYARNYRYSSTTTKYVLRYRLPARGYWYVKAFHADSGHYPTYSSARVFRVR